MIKYHCQEQPLDQCLFLLSDYTNVKGASSDKFYLLPAAYKLIEEALLFRGIKLVSDAELKNGYLKEGELTMVLAFENINSRSNLWLPGYYD